MKFLLIGMGPGIGMALARRFGAEGFDILMVARDSEKLLAYEEELAAGGIRARGYAADIADDTAYPGLLQQLAAEHPDLDVLHYNASAFHQALPSAIELPVFMADWKINMVGALLAAQAFLPAMKQRGRGSIFFTGGGSALKAAAEFTALSIGKAGMRNFALGLAQECAQFEGTGVYKARLLRSGLIDSTFVGYDESQCLPAEERPTGAAKADVPLEMAVFPNPASEMLRIRFGKGTLREGRLILKDLTGRMVLSKTLPDEQEAVLNIAAIPPGIYLLSWHTPGMAPMTVKVIISR